MLTLSKSDFKLARDCAAKLTWRERHYPTTLDDDPYLALLAEGGYMVEQLARMLFAEGVEFAFDPRRPLDAWRETEATLRAGDGTWFEATLLAGRWSARVDILRRRGNHFDLFEVKSKSFDGDDLDDRPHGPFRGKRAPYAIRSEWRAYLDDVTFQVAVLRRCFPDATVTPHLIVVDKSRTTVVDGLPRLFDVQRGTGSTRDLTVRFIGDRTAIDPGELLCILPVGDEVDDLLEEVTHDADAMAARYTDDGVIPVVAPLGMHCRDCEFRVDAERQPSGFRECWGPLAEVSPSVLDLHQFGSTKCDGVKLGDLMIQNGRVGLDEVDVALLVKKDGSPTQASVRQKIQIEHSRTNRPWYGPGLAAALDQVSYPLHFIDFETSALALPYHAGMRPYQSVAFQWSCHTVSAPGADPSHTEWLNTTDCWPSLAFAESLHEALGEHGTIMMWTAYERTILRKTGEQLGERHCGSAALRDWLGHLGDSQSPSPRLVDQKAICASQFFHPRMGGSNSIKKVLDALWHDDEVLRQRFARWMGADTYAVAADQGPYEGLPVLEVGGTTLDVADGTGAMRAYQAMMYGAERHDPAITAAWAHLLRRYCKLDTLAMVLIWDHWVRHTAE